MWLSYNKKIYLNEIKCIFSWYLNEKWLTLICSAFDLEKKRRVERHGLDWIIYKNIKSQGDSYSKNGPPEEHQHCEGPDNRRSSHRLPGDSVEIGTRAPFLRKSSDQLTEAKTHNIISFIKQLQIWTTWFLWKPVLIKGQK